MRLEALALKSSNVRNHFSEFMDTTLHKHPQVVVRNRDHIIAMNVDHMAVLLQDLTLTARVEQDEEGSFIATLDEVDDLIGYDKDGKLALYSLAEQFIEYANDYMTDGFTIYFNAPNRKRHFPYVLKVLFHDTPEEVLSFFRVQY